MLTHKIIADVVQRALDEDAPWGDVTSEHLIPATATATAELAAREAGVFSGADVFAAAFLLTDPSLDVQLFLEDGDSFVAGQELGVVTGSARSVLTAERIGLNFVQRMSGVATLTAKYVEAVAGTKARIVDTRKTLPGLRQAQKYAVRTGGGRVPEVGLTLMLGMPVPWVDASAAALFPSRARRGPHVGPHRWDHRGARRRLRGHPCRARRGSSGGLRS